ncbi:hypothetical protein C8R43DRAFT_869375 [Mycena crocata]|nr:hypothetical protein C8R43DRAFT_869375 [Mycena crocata]
MNEEEVTRVEDLWFSQDALVIRAENRIFRVTKSILAARSLVFSDMVALPQPAGTLGEIFAGSPVVRLHDSAVAVEVFLRAIFDSSYFMPPPAPVELHTLLAILRLSHKYDVRYLHLRALQHLSEVYGPASVDDYRAFDQSGRTCIINPTLDSHCLMHLSVIAAATEVSALWLLPVAYYLASTSRPEHLRTMITLGAQEYIVQNCLSAQRDLVRGTGTVWSFLSATPRSDCVSRRQCAATLKAGLDNLIQAFLDECDLCPLDDWHDSEDGFGSLENGLCWHCFSKAKADHAERLKELWDRLPGIYGLPPWPELKALRETVTGTAE